MLSQWMVIEENEEVSQNAPFLGIFTADPQAIAASISRPTTPFVYRASPYLEIDTKSKWFVHEQNESPIESPVAEEECSFKWNVVHPHNIQSMVSVF